MEYLREVWKSSNVTQHVLSATYCGPGTMLGAEDRKSKMKIVSDQGAIIIIKFL